ncbi:hypothetical protein Pcinc_027639 [Petrolisthes cinctipes]|uniref:Reverse transcriptase domain-containing protein n=1 Tax=Petrolisthes cinctipes TaxID=88211 RepID=A0AAE1F4R4_PETCI|nr:hypothetical protein Pcinc_027639 [Petrolisthes cinctipes]
MLPPHVAVASIAAGHTYWMTIMDATMGYHQIAIAPESQDLTCFITPWGRYKFKHAVMRLVSSGDEYNRTGYISLDQIPNTIKVVDDILAYDNTYQEHLQHMIKIMKRCDDTGITLNPRKFLFARNEVDYCGFKITEKGYSANDTKVTAIKNFPLPENITDLRSFTGLVNQLGRFPPEIAAMA